MKHFSKKMPLSKNLSYAFARVTGRDIMCTRMVCQTQVVSLRLTVPFTSATRPGGDMNVYNFKWFEARPVKGEAGLYTVLEHTYLRNELSGVSGDHRYTSMVHRKDVATPQTADFFTRDEAVRLLQQCEKKMLDSAGVYAVEKAPSSLKALNVHQRAGVANVMSNS